MSKKKVLFVTYGGGHVNMIVPVVKALMARRECEVVVLGLTTAGVVLDRANIPYIGFKDIVSDAAALEHGRRLSEGVHSDTIPFDETIAYMGLSYADLEARHGRDEAARLYAEKGRHVFLPITAIARLLQQIQPDLVVATNAPRAERAAILAAREAGIPAVCIVDLYPPKDGEWLKENWFGKKICVLNNTAKEMLVANGRCGDDIVVTGNPAFDRHYLFKESAGTENLFKGKTVVGLASNSIPGLADGEKDGELQREVFERVQKLCSDKNYTLALRQHPNETAWRDIGDAADCTGMALDSYLASLDMLITFPSTIALEAQIHGVRVALLDFTPLSEACSYLFNGDFEALKRLEEVDNLIVASARTAKARDTNTASAATNVCDVIIKVLEEIN